MPRRLHRIAWALGFAVGGYFLTGLLPGLAVILFVPPELEDDDAVLLTGFGAGVVIVAGSSYLGSRLSGRPTLSQHAQKNVAGQTDGASR